MHEMSLAESVLQIIEESAGQHGFTRVSAIVLEVGELAGVEIEALRFALEVVTRESIAQGAGVEIVPVPGSGWCMECADTVPISEAYSACPRCGGFQIQVTGGTEMRVRELTVE